LARHDDFPETCLLPGGQDDAGTDLVLSSVTEHSRTPGLDLFVLPDVHRRGFHASIRGNILELADPNGGVPVAPTAEDLYVAALASFLAWTARDILRKWELPEDPNVLAQWQPSNSGAPIAAEFTIAIALSARTAGSALLRALGDALSQRFDAGPPRFRLRLA
jgi:hypothetical protein